MLRSYERDCYDRCHSWSELAANLESPSEILVYFKEPHHLAEVDDTDTLLDCSRECHFSSKKFRDQYGYSYQCLPVVAGSLFTKAYP